MRTRVGAVVIILAVALGTIALAEGNWDDAKSKYEEFTGKYQDLRTLTPTETKKLVTAICEQADQDERRSIARDVSDRVANELDDKYDDLKDLKDDTLEKLQDVIDDDKLQDQHSDAQAYRDDVTKKWQTIQRMTKSLRGKNHPVVRYLIQQGEALHDDYQKDHCQASEFVVPSGKADCVMAEDCVVVEIKPNNSRAISKGKEQAARYTDDINNSQDLRNKLIELDSDFKHCKKFSYRVDCYKLCPDIDPDTNEMESVSADWDENCD